MVTIAFAHQDLRDITIFPALVEGMERLSTFQRWSRSVNKTEWVTRRLPALLLHWCVLGSLIDQLTRAQQVEVQDSVVEEIDNLLAEEAPGPTVDEEAMETESTELPIETVNEVPEAGSRSEPTLGSYASVTAQPATARRETVCDEEPQLYDGHFHLDRMLGKNARVSEMLRMPLTRRSGTTGRLRGGVVVFFCDPHSYPRNVDRIVDVPGFIPAVGIHPKQVSTWTASEMESFKILMRSTKVKVTKSTRAPVASAIAPDLSSKVQQVTPGTRGVTRKRVSTPAKVTNNERKQAQKNENRYGTEA
ncbi:ATP-dependent DNA helicase [Elysia marginata]|uniref:ATP-dependent DNA helicase n=1 Tax=Elysia marginata TaxID=1093978 RepID=A0AAV4G1R3_9GAST|nr:ATP-dependent DNA helicase [Elysia marginata]